MCIFIKLINYYNCCTTIELKYNNNKNSIVTRTMEYGLKNIFYNYWRLNKIPRYYNKYNNKYGYIIIDIDNNKKFKSGLLATEGMNENGFSISAQILHQSIYQSSKNNYNNKEIIYFNDLVVYALSNFDNVNDFKNGLKDILVINPFIENKIINNKIKLREVGCHWICYDRFGNSMVVEYLNGKLNTYKTNDIGVFTNDPSYDWHLKNLNIYSNINFNKPNVDKNIQFKSPLKGEDDLIYPSPISHGINLQGLPGDKSPASRFVRSFYLKKFTENSNTIMNEYDAIGNNLIYIYE